MATDTEIDLTVFCDPDSYRTGLSEPFVQGGRRWATNGRVAVAVDAPSEADTVPESGRLPNMQAVLGWQPKTQVSEPWPEPLYRFGLGNCRKCEGTGAKHHRDCEHCEGDGETQCNHCGHDYECKECRGVGKITCGKCEVCDGAKKVEQPLYLQMPNGPIAFDMDQHIRKLPGVRFTGANAHVAWFAFDGGIGCIATLDNIENTALSEPRRYEPAA